MSTLFVDTINEKTSGNGVAIPGHVVQAVTARSTGAAIGSTSGSFIDSGIGISITPKFATSKILVETSFTATSSQGNAADCVPHSRHR